ncbi:sigma-70 family RNA polymerase sigma factor [Kitasatospora sp. NPDC056327]|uniref:sigma-70 family RNA polymerase sigma factor n=1 Tax=Kitasatospora sp. NPDC056327 TaxID=3345785 RepID=UPI0035DC804A
MTTSTEGPRDAVLAAYERQVDGLFTYCLSVLCEHEAAGAALREVRELAVRYGGRLAEPGLLRAWLYSLARYSCLRRLADGAAGGTGGPVGPAVGDRPGGPAGSGGATGAGGSRGSGGEDGFGFGNGLGDGFGDAGAEAVRRRRELASLAWPEAAGTDPEQREALELAVRHRLSPIEVAAVLGQPFDTVRVLLAAALAEVDRTRAALLVLGAGGCPELERLGGAGSGTGTGTGTGTESRRDRVIGPALRRELVRHVVDCPTCRGTAERVAGEAPEDASTGLPVLGAPVGAARGAGTTGSAGGAGAVGRAGPVGGAGAPADGPAFLPSTAARERGGRRAGAPVPVTEPGLRFDQGGFPRHRAPEPGRGPAVRRRVVTTGVLAAVLAAPVVALWAGHRGGAGPGTAAAVSSVRVEGDGRAQDERRPDGTAGGGAGGTDGSTGAAGTVGAVIGAGGRPYGESGPATPGMELAGAGPLAAETLPPWIQGPLIPVPAHGATPLGSPALVAAPPTAPAPGGRAATAQGGPGGAAEESPAPSGLLTVEAAEYANRTVLTLTNSGGTEIHWHAVVDAPWLRLSRDAGTLAPGQRITVIVGVDEDLAPATRWTARIALPPSQAVVTLEGGPQHRGGATPSPAGPGTGEPTTTPGPVPTDRPTPSGSPSTATGPATPSPAPSPTASPTAGPGGAPTDAPTGSPAGTPTAGPPAPETPTPSPPGSAPATGAASGSPSPH